MGIPGKLIVVSDEEGRPYTIRQEISASSVLADMFMASVAATGATVLVHPIDMAKVRIQMQGELRRWGEYKVHYRNVPQAVYQIMKYDGMRNIYRGLIPATFYQIITQGFRLSLFQTIEDLGLTRDENLEPSVLLSAVSGGFCGAVTAFIASPLFMVKSYMMIRSASKIAVGHQRQYTGMMHAFQDIYMNYPLGKGLFRATGSNMLRISVGSAFQLSTFVGMKNILNLSVDYNERYMFFNCILAALVSSVVTAPLVASLDLIRVRMYIQPTDSYGIGTHYKSIRDCVRQIRRKEGFRGFWKGSTGAFFYVLITSSVTLVSWDEMRHLRNERINARDYLIDFGYQ